MTQNLNPSMTTFFIYHFCKSSDLHKTYKCGPNLKLYKSSSEVTVRLANPVGSCRSS